MRFVGVQIAKLSAHRAGKGRALGTESDKALPKRTRTSPRQPASVVAGPQARLTRADADLLRPPSEQWTTEVVDLIAASRGCERGALAACSKPGPSGLEAAQSLSSVSSAPMSLHTPTPEAGGPATCLSLGASASLSGSFVSSLGSVEDRSASLSSAPGPSLQGATDVAARAPPMPLIASLPPVGVWADGDRAEYYTRCAAMKSEHAYTCQQILKLQDEREEPEMMETWAWSVLSSLAGRFTQRGRAGTSALMP